MNPMFAAAVGSIFRWGLAFLAGYLVSRGIWTPQESAIYVTAAAAGLTAIVWAVYEKYISRAKLVTAMATPRLISEEEVEKLSSDPQRPPVSIDKDRTPYPVGETRVRRNTAPGDTPRG